MTGTVQSDDAVRGPETELYVIALAASAGGLVPIRRIVASLPADTPAAVLIIQHTSPGQSHLVPILARESELPIKQAEGGDRLEPGRIYVAPPDNQMLLNDQALVSLAPSEREQHKGPSANRLFESLAQGIGSRTIAVVLSGMRRDGSVGIGAIKAAGGTVIAQDEATSEFPSMPRSAVETGHVDFILPDHDIAAKLLSLVEGERSG